MIENAKRIYFLNVGNILAQKAGSKAYWTLMNSVLNKTIIGE